MATHASALKRHRQSLKRQERNRARASQIKTLTKKAKSATDKTGLLVALQNAVKAIDKAKGKGTLHKKTAARKISRLSKWVNSHLPA